MSLVGTRPILQDELLKYELHHRARIAIKPGITGMWQVSGRSDITDFEEVVRLDTEYISNDNIWRDVLDLTHGSNLKLYIRDANYYIIGHHRNIEEKGDDSWIVLTEFIKHSKDDNRVIETHDGKEKDMIAIRLSDVEYAEIFN